MSFLIETKIIICIDDVNLSSEFNLTFCNTLNSYYTYAAFFPMFIIYHVENNTRFGILDS